jgi:predicted nucleotidyltransferase
MLESAMNDSLPSLLRELRTNLAAIYGSRLKGVYLFGSYARKEADPESDVDVLIVLDRVDHYSQEVDMTSPLISRLSLQHNVSVSRVFVSEHEWAERQTPFLVNVREEAIPA